MPVLWHPACLPECDKLGRCLSFSLFLGDQIFINNEFHDAKEGKTLPVIDPCTGETYLQCAAGTAADVDAACQAAHKAFSSGAWPNTTGAVSALLCWLLHGTE